MKTLIIDASVAAKWFFPEDLSSAALRLFSPRRRLFAPDLIWSEVANVVWKRVKRKDVSADEGRNILEDFLRTPLEIIPSSPLLLVAYELATATGRTVYDCLYLSLAVSRNCVLVTADRRFFQAVSRTSLRKHVRLLGIAKRK